MLVLEVSPNDSPACIHTYAHAGRFWFASDFTDFYGLFSSIMEITDDDGRCNNSAPPHNMVASLKIFQNLIQNLSVGDSSCQIFIQIFVRF